MVTTKLEFALPKPEMPSRLVQRPTDRTEIDVAIFCALPIEFDAMEVLLHDIWEDSNLNEEKTAGDPNFYTRGRIASCNVVLVRPPGWVGISSASVASVRASFPNVRLGLVVGICSGVPQSEGYARDIFLGDVIISTGLVEFNFGRQYPDNFVRKDTIQHNFEQPNLGVQAFLSVNENRLARTRMQQRMSEYTLQVDDTEGSTSWSRPKPTEDQLYEDSYRHKHQDPNICMTCAKCENAEDAVCDAALSASCAQLGCHKTHLITRLSTPTEPNLHFGLMATGYGVMKSAVHRNRIARDHRVIGFENGSAEVCDSFPTIIIKGVCDYADSHKDKIWQRYAALAAAACAKALMDEWHWSD